MTKSIINIGLACGGTGGHISPALALASNFENYNIKPVFITDVRGSSLLKSMSHYVVLSGSPSSKGFTKVINMLKIFFGILQSTYYLYRTKVNLVIGFGGYTSVPIILEKFGIDPAIATGPFITTGNDAVSYTHLTLPTKA